MLGLGPDDSDDIGSPNRVESLSSRKVTDRGGGVAAELFQAKEDVNARLDWAGYRGVQFEVRDVLTSDGVFLVVQGEENLSRLVEVLDWGVHREETVPNKEQEVQNICFFIT